MTRMAPTETKLTLIQGFVLGRLRDAGPMTSADFHDSRDAIRNGRHEWAKPILNALATKGYVVSAPVGPRSSHYLTEAGQAAIADLPTVPRRMEAMRDAEGTSTLEKTALSWNSHKDPDAITPDDVKFNFSGPYDAAEEEEIARITALLRASAIEITDADFSP